MAMGMAAALQCAVCGSPATRVEIVAPGRVPAEMEQWKAERRQAFGEHRDPGSWCLLSEGVAAGNGRVGDGIEETGELIEAAFHEAAFHEPYTYAQVPTAGFYDDAASCEQCDAAYCYRHWRVSASETGFGYCPQGHGKSPDPHW